MKPYSFLTFVIYIISVISIPPLGVILFCDLYVPKHITEKNCEKIRTMAGQDDSNCNGDTNMGNNSEPIDENNEENIKEEYELLDTTLDELNTALDYLERKNDDIHERLKELLQSNIDIRNELRSENMEVTENK